MTYVQRALETLKVAVSRHSIEGHVTLVGMVADDVHELVVRTSEERILRAVPTDDHLFFVWLGDAPPSHYDDSKLEVLGRDGLPLRSFEWLELITILRSLDASV